MAVKATEAIQCSIELEKYPRKAAFSTCASKQLSQLEGTESGLPYSCFRVKLRPKRIGTTKIAWFDLKTTALIFYLLVPLLSTVPRPAKQTNIASSSHRVFSLIVPRLNS